ncbi:hypothetical protein CBR71_19675 [Bordetella hinzii]|nr:hypothetical protein CBR71_19675 [Bordetella hinzii]
MADRRAEGNPPAGYRRRGQGLRLGTSSCWLPVRAGMAQPTQEQVACLARLSLPRGSGAPPARPAAGPRRAPRRRAECRN